MWHLPNQSLPLSLPPPYSFSYLTFFPFDFDGTSCSSHCPSRPCETRDDRNCGGGFLVTNSRTAGGAFLLPSIHGVKSPNSGGFPRRFSVPNNLVWALLQDVALSFQWNARIVGPLFHVIWALHQYPSQTELYFEEMIPNSYSWWKMFSDDIQYA